VSEGGEAREDESGGQSGASPLQSAQALFAGEHATCALLDDGHVVCWGTFDPGCTQGLPLACQHAPRPVVLPGDVRMREISLGHYHARGLAHDGRLMHWGRFLHPFKVRGERGKLLVPVAEELEPYEQVAERYPAYVQPSVQKPTYSDPGAFDALLPLWSGIADVRRLHWGSCYETRAGEVICASPLTSGSGWRVDGAHRFPDALVVVVAAGGHACVLEEGGGVSCWYGNDDTEVSFEAAAAMRLPLPGPAVELVFGSVQCAVLDDGRVACWDHDMLAQMKPDDVTGLHLDVREGLDATSVSVAGSGVYFETWVCARTKSGRVKCWAPLVNPPTVPLTSEQEHNIRVRDTPGVENAVAVAAGATHACALTSEGRVWCWGGNEYGECGRGTAADGYHPPALVISAVPLPGPP
jgi:hypothetical protein